MREPVPPTISHTSESAEITGGRRFRRRTVRTGARERRPRRLRVGKDQERRGALGGAGLHGGNATTPGMKKMTPGMKAVTTTCRRRRLHEEEHADEQERDVVARERDVVDDEGDAVDDPAKSQIGCGPGGGRAQRISSSSPRAGVTPDLMRVSPADCSNAMS